MTNKDIKHSPSRAICSSLPHSWNLEGSPRSTYLATVGRSAPLSLSSGLCGGLLPFILESVQGGWHLFLKVPLLQVLSKGLKRLLRFLPPPDYDILLSPERLASLSEMRRPLQQVGRLSQFSNPFERFLQARYSLFNRLALSS